MRPWVLELGVVAISVAGFFAVYALMLLVTRPLPIRAAPAAQELGPEPPAVVGLLCGGWKFTEDPIEATLLDLGARGFFEFRQPANDPMQTTIHLRPGAGTRSAGSEADVSTLTSYERRVLDHVVRVAVGGVLPMTALTFRDKGKAETWWKHLRKEIIADTRARGLSRRRFGRVVIGVLFAAATLAAAGIAYAVAHNVLRDTDTEDDFGTILVAGGMSLLFLGAFALRDVGERDTPAGRLVAARWLGVRDQLRADKAFGELPPAAVAVWNRYIGYGAALGVSRVASAVVDLGMGNRKLVWSSFGGTWHRVRVRYPGGGRYGVTAPKLLLRVAMIGFAGYLAARVWRPVVEDVASFESVADYRSVADLVGWGGFLFGVGLLFWAAYSLVRWVLDLAFPVVVEGQVLWIESWHVSSGGDDSPSVPVTYYLAVDDGTGDRTTAWALPAALNSRFDVGYSVKIRCRRWSRRVVAVWVSPRQVVGDTAGAVPR
ncbi:hypothetical protein F4553_003062 [Allocatelliglobosispora scoriae]|uniref:Predicted membrane protein YciQ-like C-terminal domain-containing protein n=1 Tax=Allocatelliglobosispora scoriae TaxID=643052 RepID=A0A841BS00_9ACTN|nr:DUF2207 domain-containing protein [Allocatelliglobosispora scoriae]MBB5869683.1 hypothetical protein [Allocatelliglobosispora scoriae]